MIDANNHGYGLAFVDMEHDFIDDVEDTESSTETSYVKHTYDDFGLLMTSLYIPEPEVKRQVIDIPFGSGSIDLTEAAGTIPYADREGLSFEFFVKNNDPQSWATAMTNLAMTLHGKKMKMRSDYELDYYFVVRLHIDNQKSDKTHAKIVVTGIAEPFKYSIIASNDPWRWDPFNFETGQIVDTSDIVVDGETTVTIPASGIMTTPTIIVTQAGTGLGIVYNTNPPRVLPMSATGTYRFPQIKAGGDSTTTLTFVGQGRVSVAYRSRFL